MYEDFVRERVTQLRLKKGVSEYQMSYDLGHSRGYVYNISSGKALPPLKEFFSMIISTFHLLNFSTSKQRTQSFPVMSLRSWNSWMKPTWNWFSA